MSSESGRCLRERQETCFEAFAPAMSLGLSKQREIGPQLKKQPITRAQDFSCPSFVYSIPPLLSPDCRAEQEFSSLSSAVLLMPFLLKEGKARRGGACVREEVKAENSHICTINVNAGKRTGVGEQIYSGCPKATSPPWLLFINCFWST